MVEDIDGHGKRRWSSNETWSELRDFPPFCTVNVQYYMAEKLAKDRLKNRIHH